jgi:hypothetical protein
MQIIIKYFQLQDLLFLVNLVNIEKSYGDVVLTRYICGCYGLVRVHTSIHNTIVEVSMLYISHQHI